MVKIGNLWYNSIAVVFGGLFMFLNVGADVDVFLKDIVAVIDIVEKDDENAGQINNEFVANMFKQKKCVVLDKNVSRSAIVVEKLGEITVYLSPLSVKAIRKRLQSKSILKAI